jgi:hypothetical protein
MAAPSSLTPKAPATRAAPGGSVRWRSALPPGDLADVDLYSVTGPTGRVLIVPEGQTLLGFDAATGAQQWQIELPADSNIDGVATAAGGLVLQISQTNYAIEGH